MTGARCSGAQEARVHRGWRGRVRCLPAARAPRRGAGPGAAWLPGVAYGPLERRGPLLRFGPRCGGGPSQWRGSRGRLVASTRLGWAGGEWAAQRRLECPSLARGERGEPPPKPPAAQRRHRKPGKSAPHGPGPLRRARPTGFPRPPGSRHGRQAGPRRPLAQGPQRALSGARRSWRKAHSVPRTRQAVPGWSAPRRPGRRSAARSRRRARSAAPPRTAAAYTPSSP